MADIRDFGWRGTHVGRDDNSPSFSYSTGFWLTHGQPEIIMFDLPFDLAHDLLGAIHRRFEAGDTLPVGRAVARIIRDEVVYLFPVTAAWNAEYLLSSQWLYKGPNFPSLQLVWSDGAGRFPWQAGFDPGLSNLQPDLSPEGWARSLAN